MKRITTGYEISKQQIKDLQNINIVVDCIIKREISKIIVDETLLVSDDFLETKEDTEFSKKVSFEAYLLNINELKEIKEKLDRLIKITNNNQEAIDIVKGMFSS